MAYAICSLMNNWAYGLYWKADW